MDTSFPSGAGTLPGEALPLAAEEVADQAGGRPDGNRQPQPAASVALIDCGNKVIGVEVVHVREVIPEPHELQPLASSGPGVIGCLALRGLAVPVVDFAALLGWPATAPGILVVLRIQTGLVAFRAQATRRIVLGDHIRFQDIATAATGREEQIFPRLGLIEDLAVAMLEPSALISLGIPATRDQRATAKVSDISEQYLLFELDGRDFVLPVARVHGTVPETEVGGATLVSGPCEGSIQRLDLEIALINPLLMCGMPHQGSRPKAAGAIVLNFGGEKRLALRADRVRDIIQIKKSLISPMPRVLARRGDLFLGVVPVAEDRWYHVLDPDRIMQDPALGAFASLTRRSGAGQAQGARMRGRRGTALLFRAGGDFSLPIDSVEEIVGLPQSVIDTDSQGLHLCTISHRGGLLPIFALSQILVGGRVDFGPLSAVIVVRVEGERIGLAVEEMLAIERVGFVEHPDGRPEGMVERHQPDRIRSFSLVELDQLASWTA
ncbi:chemotaxis protein CheW [Stagnihabitans tardus]|uniref:CheW-like domain-containing protein n=1 Tax=Stagnihabitans tardus TaxID=2699202 RepID=A0AAE5BT64_9RHOB|nr:chemotaxis protein CheW [Stagnihabitans tardus]NBZ86286.1 hypothetical protein [Stagnihabitans tardus]